MELVNEFSVAAELAAAWSVLTDVPAVASCLPGASIEEQDGARYRGRVEVKVGPVKLGLAGAATVLEQDDQRHLLVVRGSAKDGTGQGSAEVTITMHARAGAAGTTDVRVTTELELGGRIAQFGSGVISQVSGRIVKQFVARLDALLRGENEPAAAQPAPCGRRTLPRPELARTGLLALAGLVFGLALGRALNG
ncbi:SRPBCC family protein [Sciscionella sediminilitoris]|uniref:SRPBCC family protein n=1 Tax=Sciscionella sediminilitoris TaxID=1445613 RepID=UPI0004DEDBDD|nr:SRPBCC family protein [Sciscionella sp. SE31]